MGTPGHMAHPFDVEDIQTGEDLVDYINNAVSQLSAGDIAGSVKWDGINTSIKLITNDNGEKEFRMDRGTSAIDSIIGFDAEAAYKKWGTEHGMPKAIENVLAIFNKGIPYIKNELQTLGLWDDPTKYLNTEYIEGASNVQDYGENILAIHGINQFYEKKAQAWRIKNGSSMNRPGLARPMGSDGKPIKAGGIEIPYSHTALENLIRKVQPIAQKHNFKIFGDVPVEFDEENELDLEKILELPVQIQTEPGNVKTASLRSWLQMVNHPKDKRVVRADGKSVGALSKDIYMAVLRSAERDGVPLSEYLKDHKDIKDAIDGGIFYHATRLLGQAVKDALTSPAGPLGNHEGVVLRGLEDFLVKLTGDFIIQGLASTHGNHVSENLSRDFTVVISKNLTITKPIDEWITEAAEADHKFQKLPKMVYKDILAGTPIVDIVVQENAEKTIYNAVMGYVNGLHEEDEFEIDISDDESDDPVVDSEYPKTVAIVPGAYKPPHKGHLDMVRKYAETADEVVVIISKPTKQGRYLPDGREITSADSLKIWNVLVNDLPNVKVEASKDHASPITAAYDFIGEKGPLNIGDTIILGASTKDDDWKRWLGAEQYVKDGVKLIDPEQTSVSPTTRPSGEPYSATAFRNALGNPEGREEIADFIGEENVDAVLDILGLTATLDEMSAMGGGSVAGASAPLGSTLVSRGPLTPTAKKKKKKKTKQKEYIDLSLIDEVMKLIIERGITQ